jgi:hypothetical protein
VAILGDRQGNKIPSSPLQPNFRKKRRPFELISDPRVCKNDFMPM